MLDHYAAIDFTYPFPLYMLPHMYLAVDMFMLLSGFILAMAYEDRLGHPAPTTGYKMFIFHRIARLYPLYAFTTLISFALCRVGWLTFLHPDTSLPALVANLLAVQTWLWPGSSLNGPAWSISTEWFANLLLPLLIVPILRGTRSRAAWVGCLAFAMLVASAILYGQLFDVPSPGAVNTIAGPGSLGRCVSEFAIGMLCWRLRSRWPLARMLSGNKIQYAAVVVLLVLIQFTELDTIVVAVCAPLIIGLSYDTSRLAAALRWPPLQHLGKISYSIYLVHINVMPVRDALAPLFEAHGLPASWCLAVLCSAVLAVLLANLTWRYVERPAQKAILAWRPDTQAGPAL